VRGFKTKLSKIDILLPVQSKTQPPQRSQRFNASTTQRSARFEPAENNPNSFGTAYLRVTNVFAIPSTCKGKSQFLQIVSCSSSSGGQLNTSTSQLFNPSTVYPTLL